LEFTMPACECPWAVSWEPIGTNLSARGSRHRVQGLVSLKYRYSLSGSSIATPYQ
jgi:hypothetical protein